MKLIHEFIYSILWFFELLFTTITIRNPCKKCLVRACCGSVCNEKLHYQKFCGYNEGIGFQRTCAISIVISSLTFIIAICKRLI